MSDPVNAMDWQEGNARYLSAALTWVRLLLEREAGGGPLPPLSCSSSCSSSCSPAEPPFEPQQRSSSSSGSLFKWLMRHPAGHESERPAPLLLPAGDATDKRVEQAAAEMEAASHLDPPPALLILGSRLGLSVFERNVLLLCAAMELDTHIGEMCARAQRGSNWTHPTFALALALFDEPAWEALSPERPLRYWRLIEINQPGAQPLTASALRADERIVSYAKGLNYLDDRIAPLLSGLPANASKLDLPPSQQTVVDEIVARWEQSVVEGPLPVVQLVGPDVSSKYVVAQRAAAALGLRLYRLPVEALPQQTADLETLARLWQRESILLPLALYLDGQELDQAPAGEGQSSAIVRLLARADGFFFLGTREIQARLGRSHFAVDVAKPTPAEQQAAWHALLPEAAGDIPGLLAGQFNLNLAAIDQISRAALATTPGTAPNINQLWEACVQQTRPRMDALAQRLDPKATWEDLVLPDEQSSLLRQIANQVWQRGKVYEEWGFARKMNRGLGINALFAGESGTGKTMAAEVIANELRLSLYRIDLSAVVSKYIGETEKNLRRLFDAAEDGGALLFFDEADALFGKRSEVKDSHDRYANIEVNYLLQRIEAYRGLAILATNMKSALDSAFMRRLRFIVNFPFPSATDRTRIWQRAFPAEMHIGELDFSRLVRLNLTGGSIHNIALNAAFLAAQAKGTVTMPLVLEAARAEFRKLEKPISEADLRWPAATGANV